MFNLFPPAGPVKVRFLPLAEVRTFRSWALGCDSPIYTRPTDLQAASYLSRSDAFRM